MRIGTIAQHSNIGPTGPGKSIIPNTVPGRLNDLNLFAWFDFTDPVAVGGGENALTADTNVLQQCNDKGPGNGDAFIDQSLSNASEKGPEWRVDGGQNNHAYLECIEVGVGGADYLRFKNPRTITDGRKLGFVLIYDLNSLPPNWVGNDSGGNFDEKEQTYFRINGDNDSFVELVQKPTGGTLFRFEFRWCHNGSTVASHTLHSSRVQSTSTVSVGGDSNENFAFVGSTGLNPNPVEIENYYNTGIDFHFQVAGEYFRGDIDRPYPYFPNNTNQPDQLRNVTGNLEAALSNCPGADCVTSNAVFQQKFQISKDGDSMLFSETHGNGAYQISNEGLNAKIYELIIFEDNLFDGSQFHSINEYIRNKYNISYNFGATDN